MKSPEESDDDLASIKSYPSLQRASLPTNTEEALPPHCPPTHAPSKHTVNVLPSLSQQRTV